MRHLLFFSFIIFSCGCTNHIDKSKTDIDSKDSTTSIINKKQVSETILGQNEVHYYYDPSITTISGIISQMSVVEPGDELNDKQSHVPIIVLKRKISVLNLPTEDTTNNDEQPNEYNLDTFQLAATSNIQYDSIKNLIGKSAEIKGKFFHGDNGNHFTPVLIQILEIHPLNK